MQCDIVCWIRNHNYDDVHAADNKNILLHTVNQLKLASTLN